MSDDNASQPLVRIDWQPLGRRVDVPPRTILTEAARLAGIELTATCGGAGLCEGCRVRATAGRLSTPTSIEQSALGAEAIAAGWRLACQALADGDATIDVPPDSLSAPQRLQVEAHLGDVEPDPCLTRVDLTLAEPVLDDLRDDLTRIADAVVALGMPRPHAGLREIAALSRDLRREGWRTSPVLRGSEIVAVVPAGTPLLGLAVDLGTTKLAGYLVDLATGRTLAAVGRMNPQIAHGEDVVSRIAYAQDDPVHARELQASVVVAINEMVAELTAGAGASAGAVVEAVVAGNTAMHHLFAGLPVAQLGQAPYVPVVAAPLEFRARDIGLGVAPGAYVYLPANVAGYVGGDHVAMLLASLAGEAGDVTVAVDIGTNTEMTVSARGRMWTCSCASGPAFEGAHISSGMRAADGAIERVVIAGGEVRFRTIGNRPAIGICGSGILDAVAEMHREGLLNRHGSLQSGHPLVRVGDSGLELVIARASDTALGRDIVITRADVSEIQLAKAAIRTGLEILMAEAGFGPGEVDRVVMAGAFGTYIDIRSAIQTGMLPAFPRARVEQVGNAAGAGARQMLVSATLRRRSESLARETQYVELTTQPAFADTFARAICL
jgi:uncharacterized 2Fe-2S/4Fe-4S cluster protein (DUF4445 family)